MDEPDVNFQAPVKSVSVENMVRMRQGVADRLDQAMALLREAAIIAGVVHLGFPRIEIKTSYRSGAPILSPDAQAIVRAEVDREAWKYLMDESGLRTFMDAEARRKWDDGLYNEEVPELTAENVAATFRSLHDSREEMFERGVIRCFRRLSWDYKTNRPFGFGKRIILGHLFSVYTYRDGVTLSLRHEAADELDDLVRVFHVVDGKPEPDHRDGMWRQISEAQQRGEMCCENDYLSVKWYLKGSGHVLFKRLALVDRLNSIVAKHYPGALTYERKGG